MPVPENPTIKIAFTGLLAFSFDEQKKNCQVGILNNVPDHSLRFKVFEVTSSKKSPGSRKKILEINGEDNNDDIILEVKRGDGKAEAIEFFTNGPFTRDESDDPQDFRWIVDIEGSEFHDRELAVVPGTFTPSFRVNDGLFYTGSIGLADVQFNEVPVSELTEIYVAIFAAANIHLDEYCAATLRFGPNAEQSLSLEFKEDTTYKIQVFNDCVKQVCADTGGDFTLYYEAFRKNFDSENNIDERFDKQEQFTITGPLVPAEDGQGANHEHPCGPIFASKKPGFK